MSENIVDENKEDVIEYTKHILKVLKLKKIPETISELNSHYKPLFEKEQEKLLNAKFFVNRKRNKIDKMMEAKSFLQLLIEDKDIVAYPEIYDIVLR